MRWTYLELSYTSKSSITFGCLIYLRTSISKRIEVYSLKIKTYDVSATFLDRCLFDRFQSILHRLIFPSAQVDFCEVALA